jgi:micrococcal nuclease
MGTMRGWLLAAMLVLGVLLTGCASDQGNQSRDQSTTEKSTQSTTAPKPPARTTAENTENTKTKPSPSEAKQDNQSPSGFEAMVTVTRVVDGDTVDITPATSGNTRVRLIGVDTPETKDPDCGVAQPYGKEASNFTTSRLQGHQVGLEFDVEKTDQYNRLLAYVYPTNDEMFNETLLKEGYAQVATFPPNVKYVDRFLGDQEAARAAGAGLWGLPPEQLAQEADRGNGIGGAGCAQNSASGPSSPPASSSSTGGSVSPLPGGDCPAEAPIKGNANSGIYHVASGQFYGKTKAEQCFATEQDAQNAGFRKSKR